jgi:hypothetical protein
LIGTALGLVVGKHVDGMRQGVAAPVMGLAGAAVGHYLDRQEADRNRQRAMAYDQSTPQRLANADAREWAGTPPPATGQPTDANTNNRHPGVDLIKFSIVTARGAGRDIPILRTGGRFVGPQGESYDQLPTTEELTRRYGGDDRQP